jgi:hypothetical protein
MAMTLKRSRVPLSQPCHSWPKINLRPLRSCRYEEHTLPVDGLSCIPGYPSTSTQRSCSPLPAKSNLVKLMPSLEEALPHTRAEPESYRSTSSTVTNISDDQVVRNHDLVSDQTNASIEHLDCLDTASSPWSNCFTRNQTSGKPAKTDFRSMPLLTKFRCNEFMSQHPGATRDG